MAYKYFIKTDKKKEAVGVFTAPSLEIAYEKAAKLKQLPLNKFIEIFEVEKIKNGK